MHKKVLSSVPEGADSLLLSRMASKANGNILYVARDELRMYAIAQQVAFFAPGMQVICLPAWDVLPYDRVSPSVSVLAERMQALCHIIHAKQRFLLITSSSSLLQKLPPTDLISSASRLLSKGDNIERDQLVHILLQNGFVRSTIASDHGEFAVRGGIVDIYPSGQEEGWRLDLFGNHLEAIRSFDPITQVSGKQLEQINLIPASELLLSSQSITSFTSGYKRLFGVNATSDPLYEAVSQGRKYPGMEHWLPLFYDDMGCLFDYTSFSDVIFDHLAMESLSEKLVTIEDHYKARLASLKVKTGGALYHPITPGLAWMTRQELEGYIEAYSEFNPFLVDYAEVMPFKTAPNYSAESQLAAQSVFDLLKNKTHKLKTIIACYSTGSMQRIASMLDSHDIHSMIVHSWQDYKNVSGKTIGLMILPLEHGFSGEDFLLISEQDLLGERLHRAKKRAKRTENFLSEAASLVEGELIVHNEHGIGRFDGLETLHIASIAHDCLRILYAGGDKLYIPVENIEVIKRYGSEDGAELDKLGGVAWQTRKARLKDRIKLAAAELLKVAAERALRTAPIFTTVQGAYEEFCARFGYVETDDQLASIEDVIADLSSGKPMDRLICGDVGFGKTEVALRAAFIAVYSGKEHNQNAQVAVVVPTTLLARQHYKTFKNRFAGLPVNIKMLSRLVTSKEAAHTKQALQEGSVDIVIGTHALLAKNIELHNLSLLIIDEEQHFGVAQKERLKQLKAGVHVLTLSATPIPRTLQMSLAGIKELSLIATPPIDRMVVKTSVMPFDPVIIREALLREHYRGGRSFYVCPRIADLAEVERIIKGLVPEIKIVVAHGQMPAAQLDQIMNDFYDGLFDLLLSTTIVESGLDVPSANSIFIHRSDMFGLAQLYQLRGRVGRGKIRAYAYLLTHPSKLLSKPASKRLEVMQTLDSLGAGFSLAGHDMDIRGFGNLVGDEQSGHIREVGIELYQDMLKQAVESLKAENIGQSSTDILPWSPQLNVGLSVLIPEDYVPDLPLRLGLYKRIADLNDAVELESFAAEMIDRFGPLPLEASHLLDIVSLKQLCKKMHITKVDAGPKGVVVSFYDNKVPNPDGLLALIMKKPGQFKLRPDHKLVMLIEQEDAEKRLFYINRTLAGLLPVLFRPLATN